MYEMKKKIFKCIQRKESKKFSSQPLLKSDGPKLLDLEWMDGPSGFWFKNHFIWQIRCKVGMDIQDILQGQFQQGKLRLLQQDYVQTRCHR